MGNDKPIGGLGHGGAERDDDLLDAITANPELARVAFLLTAPPTGAELTGLEGALETFRGRATVPRRNRRRRLLVSSLAGAKLGATIAGVAVGLGGAATAVYVSVQTPAPPDTAVTGTVPATLSRTTVATQPSTQGSAPATAPTSTGSRATQSSLLQENTADAVRPDASGPAVQGLCTAWQNVSRNGKPGKAMDAAAFQRLVAAAGGANEVEAFCAKVGAPGKAGDRATGKPSDHPARSKPKSSPTVPDEKPDTVPTASPSHPTGRP